VVADARDAGEQRADDAEIQPAVGFRADHQSAKNGDGPRRGLREKRMARARKLPDFSDAYRYADLAPLPAGPEDFSQWSADVRAGLNLMTAKAAARRPIPATDAKWRRAFKKSVGDAFWAMLAPYCNFEIFRDSVAALYALEMKSHGRPTTELDQAELDKAMGVIWDRSVPHSSRQGFGGALGLRLPPAPKEVDQRPDRDDCRRNRKEIRLKIDWIVDPHWHEVDKRHRNDGDEGEDTIPKGHSWP